MRHPKPWILVDVRKMVQMKMCASMREYSSAYVNNQRTRTIGIISAAMNGKQMSMKLDKTRS